MELMPRLPLPELPEPTTNSERALFDYLKGMAEQLATVARQQEQLLEMACPICSPALIAKIHPDRVSVHIDPEHHSPNGTG